MDFLRDKDGFPYAFEGVKVNSPPNTIGPKKSPYAQNIRTILGSQIRVRPGQALRFSTGGAAITDLRAYAALSTDNLPRILARDVNDKVWLDNSSQVGSLSPGGLGATFIPFRPNQSPQPWLYVANGADFQKFSSPSPSVVQRKAGIAEPQAPPDACVDIFGISTFSGADASGNWVAGGTAAAPSNPNRTTDSVVALFQDPASVSPTNSTRYSMQVGSPQYQQGESINVAKAGGGSEIMVVQDVFPAITTQTTITIASIFYFSGSTGRCVIVPSPTAINSVVPEFIGEVSVVQAINTQQLISSLRRGSLLKLNNGGGNQETVFVLSVTQGPTGLIAIECSTTNTHVATETITGLPAIGVCFTETPATFVGQAITNVAIQSSITAGTGFLSLTISAANNPFILRPVVQSGGPLTVLISTAQQDDYVHVSLNADVLTNLTSIRIFFDVGDGSFTQNYFYYDIQPSALVASTTGAQTQLGAAQAARQQALIRENIDVNEGAGIPGVPIRALNPELGQIGEPSVLPGIIASGITNLGASQWTEIMFPISSLTRVGNDQTKSLANTNGCRIQAITTGTVVLQFGALWVEGAGGQTDVGSNGALYFYKVRPRDSRTGAVGNPSPATRYGVAPRRQAVIVSLPSAAYDSQIDTWDIFRFGGSVTDYRYVGSTPASQTAYSDNVFDTAAQVGDSLDLDNFEPWPSIDLPQVLTATNVNGTIALVTIPSPTNALRWLPGTLVQIAGGQVGQFFGGQTYTLRLRPVLVSGTTYRIEFVECAAPLTNVTVTIQEPILGNQKLPYMFGPDASGRVIGIGDPLRPGTFSYCKPNNLDSVPDTYNRELTPVSEPLLGGEIIDGRGFIATPERWWELIPQDSTNPTQFYNPVQSPLPRGLAAPLGHCNDGVSFYWWAKDGIYSSATGSLTDADLYNLFPHEGVTGFTGGQAVSYAGFTIQPPDYSRVGTFRLTHSNGFLYAIYQDSNAIYRTLTLNLRTKAWCPDVYTPAVSAFYHPEQQAGTVLTSTSRYDETLMATVDGRVASQADLTNDLGGPIVCVEAAFEYDGGDIRAPVQWGDFFVDLVAAAPAGVSLTPVSAGAAVAAAQVVASSIARQRIPVTVGGLVVSDFMGLLAQWTENYSTQTVPTVLTLWQPSFDIQPARGVAWQTFGSSFGISGFGHIPWIEVAWVSTQPVTFTITCQDGTSPAAIVIPSSGGVYKKQFFRLTFNKGRLYAFAATSTAPFQFFMDDWNIPFGAWGRTDAYQIQKSLGVPNVEQSPV